MTMLAENIVNFILQGGHKVPHCLRRMRESGGIEVRNEEERSFLLV